MRDEQLDVYRRYLKDPLQALVIGRGSHEGAKNDDHDEWDPVATTFLEGRIGNMLAEVKSLQQELRAIPIRVDIQSSEGKQLA